MPRRETIQVFILTTARSGSTLLTDYLNSVPEVTMASEVLSPTLPCGLPAREISKRVVLRHIAASLNAQPGRIVGAKLLLRQLALHNLTLDDLRGEFPEARYLVLYRASLAEQYVSFQAARDTGKWVGRSRAESFGGTLTISPEEFIEFCRRQRDAYNAILSCLWLPECGRLISYEALARDAQLVFDQTVFPLLGIPPAPIKTQMKKQVDRPLSEVINNYNKIEEVLATEESAVLGFEGLERFGQPPPEDPVGPRTVSPP
ncbi:MAG: hypothetical protein ACT4QC_03175 [Planctomycetaceae bacterium]